MQTKPVLTQTVVEQSPGNLLHSSTVLQRPLQPRDCVVVTGVHCHSGCDWEPVLTAVLAMAMKALKFPLPPVTMRLLILQKKTTVLHTKETYVIK